MRRVTLFSLFGGLGSMVLLVAGFICAPAVAQVSVTPTLKLTPAGQLIVVNNGPGDQSDPHVSGNLVVYSYAEGTNSTIHYFDLATVTDKTVPSNDSSYYDYLSDVRGTTIVFTHITAGNVSRILMFDTSSSSASPVEIAPITNPYRQSAQIGDQTIAWQDYGFSSPGFISDIVAYDRTSATTTRLAHDSALNESPGISPDGAVIAWVKCPSPGALCAIWQATLSNGTWTAQRVSPQAVPETASHPDTDGTIIAYSADAGSGDQVHWQPVSGGSDQVLNLQGVQGVSVSGGLIAFDYLPTNAKFHELAVYDVANNVLYNLTADIAAQPGADKQLNDISVTPDGRVRVVWQVQEADLNIYAYTFSLPIADFNLGPISPMTISAGGSGSTSVTVNPVNGFSSPVNLAVTGQPNGVSASLSLNPVTPSNGGPASSVLNVNIPPFLAPTNFMLTVTGNSGTLTHATTVDVTVTSTTLSIINLVGDLLAAGCIDNGGIANALASKLSAAQAAIGGGNTQTAINTLTALKNQINAQAGKHIATSCTIGGVAFNPVTVLLVDVQGLIDSLRVGTIADPITGYVASLSGMGVAGATVSILDAGGNAVATATTDITGYYFFATTGVLVPGSSYTVAVTGLPGSFVVSMPAASPAFTWSGIGMMIGNFVLQ
jgi:hypothetical protein